MAQTAWAHVFKTDVQMSERIRGFDRPARRAPQVPIPGPVYDKVVNRGVQQGAPAEYPTLTKPYPWQSSAAAERKTIEAPIVGYIGHRPQIRPVFSQSTFMPVNPQAAVVTDPWRTSYGANFLGHRDEVARLAKSRSQGVLDRYETMRTLSASASGGGFRQ